MLKKTRKNILIFTLLIIGVAITISMLFIGKQGSIQNVILISIDTCRSDYLSCYGFERPTTPAIDELAQTGVLFENAFTPIPLTLPAHSSMLTGTYPPFHQVHDNLNYSLSESNVTLAEILEEHGYTTGAIISSFVLNRKSSPMTFIRSTCRQNTPRNWQSKPRI